MDIVKFGYQNKNMRITIILGCLILFFAACKKDKYTTEPQIRFKSISPDVSGSYLLSPQRDQAPKLTLEITDAEGDVGFIGGSDTSRIYFKNIKTGDKDSFDFPDIQTAASKNFKADVVINLFDAIGCENSGPPRPRVDTIAFEIYVTDFEKHKSNVIVTNDHPIYYQCL
jgi:hypothetical protein